MGIIEAGLGQRQPGAGQQDNPDGHVDEQHPAPVQQVGQDAPGEDADGRPAGGGRGPGAQRPAPLGWLKEPDRQEAQRGGGQDGTADALGRPGGDEPGAGLSQSAQQAAEGEKSEPQHEHPPAAEQIARPPSQHQQPGEGEGVGVDDPLLAGHRQTQVMAHLRQGHVDDGHIQHHHELRHAADSQDGPAWHPRRNLAAGASLRCGHQSSSRDSNNLLTLKYLTLKLSHRVQAVNPGPDHWFNVERTKLVPVKKQAPRDLAEEIADYWCRENPDVDRVTKMLAIRLRRAAQHLERELRRELDAYDTDVAELEVLMTLRRAAGYSSSAGALAREWQVTSGAITNRIGRLEARGWVRRDFDPADRRQVLVTLTEEGVRRIDHLLAIKTKTEQRVFGSIDRATINRLSADLRTLLLALEPPEDEEA